MEAIAVGESSFQLPDKPVLCLVTNREVSLLPLAEAVREAVAGGVDWVQVRERGGSDSAYLDLLEEVSESVRAGAEERGGVAQLWVNSRVDLALLVGAQGVHLGSRAMGPENARRLLGPDVGVSVATHSVEEASAAKTRGADLVQLAPIFDPLSKAPGSPELGVDALSRASAAGLPVLAQGGVTAERCGALRAAGAAGVAVTGTILASDNPREAASALRRALDSPTG